MACVRKDASMVNLVANVIYHVILEACNVISLTSTLAVHVKMDFMEMHAHIIVARSVKL